MDLGQYLEVFIEETKEHLQDLNQSLLNLEKEPENIKTINEIFRLVHTLKGMSATMSFSKMSTLTHDLEDVLQILRDGGMRVNSELVDLLFRCLDALEDYTNNITESGNEGTKDYSDIIAKLKYASENKSLNSFTTEALEPGCKEEYLETNIQHNTINPDQYEKNAIAKAYEMGMNAYQITIVLSKGCLLKSARAFIIFQILEKLTDIIKSMPNVEDIEDEKFDFEFTVLVVSKEDAETINKALSSISEVDMVIISKISADGSLYDNFENGKTAANVEAEPEYLVSKNENLDNGNSLVTKTAEKKTKAGKTVRVDIEKLDVLLNMVSELIIQKTRLEGLKDTVKDQTFTETVEYLERITTSLHDSVMKVRMVPIETVFNRFPRMIRDIARDLGKEINLIMSGEDTELDRTVIDEIGDPLIHILRNSADHGLESPQDRIRLGKSGEGHIYLKAYQEGNNVVIEVEDDGSGIDLEKVKNKALSKGLVNKDTADSLSQKDIIEFLFKPSFSTSEKITDISGRGVGLDVVKTQIEALSGTVDVETEKGMGSRFIIRLPLTLAIIQALLVIVGNEKFAIPLSSVKQITRINQTDIKLVQNQEVMLLRDKVIPLIRLNNVLDIPSEDDKKKQLIVVLVSKGEKLSGFVVDKLIGQQDIVIKPLNKYLSGVKVIAGATILGDGNVALILDVNSLT